MPVSMIRTFAERYGVTLIHGWGMTEMSPVGSLSIPKPRLMAVDREAEYVSRARQGRPLYGVEFKIVDPDGRRLPEDGITSGELLVRADLGSSVPITRTKRPARLRSTPRAGSAPVMWRRSMPKAACRSSTAARM